MNTTEIETRIPAAGQWAKTVTAVAERAKTGYDWSGEFVRGGELTDLPPGTLVITCDNCGSKRRPCKRVQLWKLLSTGEWEKVASADGHEWAYELRDEARRLLAQPKPQPPEGGDTDIPAERSDQAVHAIVSTYHMERDDDHAGAHVAGGCHAGEKKLFFALALCLDASTMGA